MLPDPRLSLFDAGPPEPCPERFNIAAHVTAPARERPERVALTVIGAEAGDPEAGELWTYGALAREIGRVGEGLRAAGIAPGDRVALRLGNSVAFALFFFGTIAAGGVAVVLSAQLTDREAGGLIDQADPRLVLAEDALLSGTRAVAGGARVVAASDAEGLMAAAPGPVTDTAGEDPAFLIFTSGTGGRPKGVLHAHRAAWARRMMWADWYGLGAADVVLHAGAFNWTYTLGAGLIDPWAAGASTVIRAGRADPGAWPAIAAAHRATIFAAVPGVYRQMLRAAEAAGRDLVRDFATLRHGLSAGERMPEALARAWQSATGRTVHEALGMSECSTYVSSSPSVAPRPGSSGRPQRGRRVAVIDAAGAPVPVGEAGDLAVSRRDPGLMLGYWRAPEDTQAAMRGEWFVTGDRASMDGDGYVTHLGRADDVMTALGYRVSPAEVEAALETHPHVAEIAVAELPVRADLSLIAAFVVARGAWPGEESLAAWAAERLAPYKRPRLWIAVERLPRTANGKVIRRALVAEHRRDG